MIKYKSRNDLLEKLFSQKIGCEIGVFKGDFSKQILNANPKELHLIDPFIGSFSSADKDGLNWQFAVLEEEYEKLKNHFNENKNVYLHRGYSNDVLSGFQDSYFDTIYIDGDHSYKSVKNDLNLAYRKVKNNGYISAHDYCETKFPEIVLAINEFCTEVNLKIEAITEDGCPSVIIKVLK